VSSEGTAICEASAVVRAPWDSDLLIVADNEVHDRLFTFRFDRTTAQLVPEAEIEMPRQHRPRDIEALAGLGGDQLVVVGSHSPNSQCEPVRRRRRIRVLHRSASGTFSPVRYLDSDALLTWVAGNGGACRAWLAATEGDVDLCTPLVSQSDDDCSEALNIEGAFSTERDGETTFWVGLRGPQHEGRAILGRLTELRTSLRFGRLVSLDLGGLSVRELTVAAEPDGTLVIWGIAGPVEDAPDPFRLFSFPLTRFEGASVIEPDWHPASLPSSSEGLVIIDARAVVLTDGSGHDGVCETPSTYTVIALD